MNISQVYKRMNKLDETIEWINKGLEIDPKDAELYNALGVAYEYR